MYAIEMPVTVDAQRQIHLQLPAHVRSQSVRVLIMYEQDVASLDSAASAQVGSTPVSLIDVLMQMPNVGEDVDFVRVNDQDERDSVAADSCIFECNHNR